MFPLNTKCCLLTFTTQNLTLRLQSSASKSSFIVFSSDQPHSQHYLCRLWTTGKILCFQFCWVRSFMRSTVKKKKIKWKKCGGHILSWDTPESCRRSQPCNVKDSRSAGGQLWSNQQLRCLFLPSGIWLDVLHPAGPNSEASWQWNTCLKGVFHWIPAAPEDDPDHRKGVKRKHCVLPELIEKPRKTSCLFFNEGPSSVKFLSDAPRR